MNNIIQSYYNLRSVCGRASKATPQQFIDPHDYDTKSHGKSWKCFFILQNHWEP